MPSSDDDPDQKLGEVVAKSMKSAENVEDKIEIAEGFVDYIETAKRSRKLNVPVIDPLGIIEEAHRNLGPNIDIEPVDILKFKKSKEEKCPLCSQLEEAVDRGRELKRWNRYGR